MVMAVIQYADLEYDPDDWSRMLPLIVDRKVADVIYGLPFPPVALFPSLLGKPTDFVFVQPSLRPDVVRYCLL